MLICNVFCFSFRIGGVTIMRKGKADLISDGKTGILKSCLAT